MPRNIRFLATIFTCLMLLGCGAERDFASREADWTEFQLDNALLQFSYPSQLEVRQVTSAPRTYEIADASREFSIQVSLDDGLQAPNNPQAMLSETSWHVTPAGPSKAVRVGRSRGLKQKHRSMEGFQFRTGETTVLVSERGSLVFKVDYLEQHDQELQPILKRVVKSLRFDDATARSTTTRTVALGP